MYWHLLTLTRFSDEIGLTPLWLFLRSVVPFTNTCCRCYQDPTLFQEGFLIHVWMEPYNWTPNINGSRKAVGLNGWRHLLAVLCRNTAFSGFTL